MSEIERMTITMPAEMVAVVKSASTPATTPRRAKWFAPRCVTGKPSARFRSRSWRR
jgi:hypothetical protein